MIVTRGRRTEAQALAKVMYISIRHGAHRYSALERRAWVPKIQSARNFAKVFTRHDVWVARSCLGPQGFIAVRRDGYVNLVFVLPTAQGCGLFKRLMQRVENTYPGALTVHASLHAEAPFAAIGFQVLHRERVKRNGQVLRRCFMQRGQSR